MAMVRRTMSVWRSVEGPPGGRRRGRRTGSSGSSRKDRRIAPSAGGASGASVGESMHGGQDALSGTRTRNWDETFRDRLHGRAAHCCRWAARTLHKGSRTALRARLILGRYRLERRLGAGGFGVVWLAWDEKLEREVAVKAIPRDGGAGERVEREARAAARLNHPGIVAIYELASDEHDVYLVSELVRGRTLAELVHARRDRRPRRGPHRNRALRGPGARARARGHPPRREAAERDGARRARRRGRIRQARRLRRGARDERRPAHAHRRRGRARSPTWRRSRPRARA